MDGNRHALAQPQVGIFHNDPKAIDEVSPEVRVSTDFGVNSATGDMNPTVPR